MSTSKTRALVECAILVAIAVMLSIIPAMELPYGGSVTYGSMVPIVLISYRHGTKWGLISAFVFSLLQMLMGKFYPPPTPTFINFVLVVLLDYVIAFSVLGFAGAFGRAIKNPTASVAVGAFSVTVLRYLCHFISGMLIWGAYAEAGQPVWLYSLTYNGGYMIPEIILTTVLSVLVFAALRRTGILKKS